MATLARWCFRHRRIVVPAWLFALLLVATISHAVGSSYANNFSFPATDSESGPRHRQSQLPRPSRRQRPGRGAGQERHAVRPPDPAAVVSMLGKVQKLGFVTDVTSPYSSGLISKDGTIGFATVQLDSDAQNLPEPEAKVLIHTAEAARSSTLNVQLGGAAIQNAENQGGGSGDFLIGALLALVVLFFAFRRAVLSALLPLLSALVAIGIGTSFIAILSHAFSVPQFATQLAELIALGVGVDYALFIVNRHRRELLAGRSPEEAVVRALNTSGRAVLVAGLTVCIALLGMFALALTFLYGVSLGAALVVFLTMLSSITLLPAMLGFYGYKALSRQDRRGLLGEAQTAAGGRRPRGQPLLDQVGQYGRSPLGRAQRHQSGADRGHRPALLRPAPGLGRFGRRSLRLDHPARLRPAGPGLRARIQQPAPVGGPGQRPCRPAAFRHLRRRALAHARRGQHPAHPHQPQRQGRRRDRSTPATARRPPRPPRW